MPSVEIHYGPYWQNHIIRHKTQRLRSLIKCLTKMGYKIELIPSPHFERVTVVMKGREIFRCNITHLQFNIECEKDIICERLVDAVKEAQDRLYSKNNVASYSPVSKGKKVIEEIKNAKTAQDLFKPTAKIWFEIPGDAAKQLAFV
ncbi:hypothetical protein ILUMI_00826 [Ignelater luminosus]|uniref:Uncharacterized protein n=1 Tax=Ignelater luminosus TaxID=2038154 RepID=A0A8K0DRX2_IGNLU|nr:hypothetical protein ILUMI_00826 [Ignelater luminosus]